MRRAFWHWGLVVCVALGSVLPGSPAQAENIDMVFSTTLCGNPYKLLRRYVHGMANWKVRLKPGIHRGTVFASGLVDMFAMMQEAGVPREEIDEIYHLIRPNPDEPIQRDPVFSQLIDGLRAIELSRKFVVCVFDQHCKYQDGLAGFIHSGMNRVRLAWGLSATEGWSQRRFSKEISHDEVVEFLSRFLRSFKQLDSPALLFLPQREGMPLDEPLLVRLVDRPLAKAIAETWSMGGYFFHETLHYVDHQILVGWIDANERLERAGQETSQWYKTYVRRIRGVTYVSGEFNAFFLELRSAYIETLLVESRLKAKGMKLSKRQRSQIRDFFRARFILSLSEQGISHFVQAGWLNRADVFTDVHRIRETMLQDIVRAGTLVGVMH